MLPLVYKNFNICRIKYVSVSPSLWFLGFLVLLKKVFSTPRFYRYLPRFPLDNCIVLICLDFYTIKIVLLMLLGRRSSFFFLLDREPIIAVLFIKSFCTPLNRNGTLSCVSSYIILHLLLQSVLFYWSLCYSCADILFYSQCSTVNSNI